MQPNLKFGPTAAQRLGVVHEKWDRDAWQSFSWVVLQILELIRARRNSMALLMQKRVLRRKLYGNFFTDQSRTN
jgi:hypothetical protein